MTIFFWSSSLVAIRIALSSYDPGSLAFFRYAIASIGMIFVWIISQKHRVNWRDIPVIFFVGAIGFGVYNVALNYGAVTVTAGVAGFIISQIPISITLLAIIFLNERLSTKAWWGMCISVIGVFLIAISHPHEGKIDVGIFYLLLAVIAAGIYAVTYKHLLIKYNPVELTAYGIWSGALSLLFYAPTLWKEIPAATTTATWAVVYLGIFPGLISYVSWSYVLKHVQASKASSTLYIMPIITVFLGWLCLGEIPSLLALIGGFIALGGAVIVNGAKSREKIIVSSTQEWKEIRRGGS